MTTLQILALLAALCGHLALWCALFNQVHATNRPRIQRKLSEKLIYLVVLIGIVMLVTRATTRSSSTLSHLGSLYQWPCFVGFGYVAARWLIGRLHQRNVSEVVSVETSLENLESEISTDPHKGIQAKMLARLPGNESLMLSTERRVFRIPGWPSELDGMVVAHLSDFHFTGKICREYFEKVVERCNECKPDVVCITGDIVDSAQCLDWLPLTLGRLKASSGKFYVLGNHDLRVKNEPLLRRTISETGCKAVSGEWQPVELRGQSIFLAGNELPWFEGAADLKDKPPGPSIMLSHSPDQIYRAVDLEVDLVLAGHCHGGQIRLPLIGPIVSPSKYGIRFAGGTFKVGHTLMHVSRGLSGDDPIRWNCPPELNIIKIRTGSDS